MLVWLLPCKLPPRSLILEIDWACNIKPLRIAFLGGPLTVRLPHSRDIMMKQLGGTREVYVGRWMRHQTIVSAQSSWWLIVGCVVESWSRQGSRTETGATAESRRTRELPRPATDISMSRRWFDEGVVEPRLLGWAGRPGRPGTL